MLYRLLVVESDPSEDVSVPDALAKDASYACRSVDWTLVAPASLNHTEADAVVAVAARPVAKVIDLFEWVRGLSAPIPTLAVLPKEPEEPLLKMASASADDFMLSPIRTDELHHRLRRILGSPDGDGSRPGHPRDIGVAQLVGNDPVFIEAVRQVPRFAQSDMPVLITGETGTGKELCARALHDLSRRKDAPFVAVDCAALPDQLFENEFFGHARGAFTDASRPQRGLIGMAAGGTLFLDEVDGLSPSAQAKLLRFLQERTYRPLGADRFEHADVNVIAATNRDLEGCVRDREFRSDLFFRLNVLRVHLPPLRERRGDVAWLAWHFLDELRQRRDSIRRCFSVSSLRKLSQHDWPGNVRELRNVVQRAAILAEATISPCHLSIPDAARPAPASSSNFRQARAAFEQAYVEKLLRKHHGNITHAADEAQKERRAFGRLVKKYNLSKMKSSD